MHHILILDQGDFIGGAELFNLDLMRTVDSQRFKLTVVTNGQKEYLQRLPAHVQREIAVVPRWKKLVSDLAAWRRLAKFLRQVVRQNKIELVHTNTVRMHLLAALLLRSRPIVWYIHDFTFPRLLIRYFGRYPRAIICNSTAVADYLRANLSPRFHAKITVIPNGVEVQKITTAPVVLNYLVQDEPKNISKKTGEFWIMGMGRIDWWKGYEYLIEAVAALPSGYELKVIILGRPDPYDPKTLAYYHKLQHLVSKKGLQERVIFVGWQERVGEWLAQADVFVHTSVLPEPFGRVIIEAMAASVPVIATSHGGPLDIIEAGVDGWLVPPRDVHALQKLLQKIYLNRSMVGAMRLAARHKVEQKFTLSGVARAVESVWQNILS